VSWACAWRVGTCAALFPGGAYADIMSHLSCCVRDWWPDATSAASVCAGSCPADFVCNE